jgi:hypothetical protein
MGVFTIELPQALTEELEVRRISTEQVQSFVVEAIESWLHAQSEVPTRPESQDTTSRFWESAVSFADRLIDENRELFDRLARL